MRPNQAGNDVPAEIVRRSGLLGVARQPFEQKRRVENVDAHRRQTVIRSVRHGLRMRRLLMKIGDPPILADLHDPEARSIIERHGNAADRHVGPRCRVLIEQVAIVHLVDVVAAQNQNMIGVGSPNRFQILIHGIGGSSIPMLADSLLRRQHVDEFTPLAREAAPSLMQMPVQAHRLVLREHKHLSQAAVDAVGKSKVDDSINPRERNHGLGPISCERTKPISLASCENDCEYLRHDSSSSRRLHSSSPTTCDAASFRKRRAAPPTTWKSAARLNDEGS